MKTKLKTLKDLINRGSITINSGKRIKQEAIKWVKYFVKCEIEAKSKLKKYHYASKRCALIDFHNITEEDLK